MRLAIHDHLRIRDPGSTFLRAAYEPSSCSGGQGPCHRPIKHGDLYVEHSGAPYHLECAIGEGWIECKPLLACPRCGTFFWPGQPHADTCRAFVSGA